MTLMTEYYIIFYSFPIICVAVVCNFNTRRFDLVKTKYKLNLDKSKVNL